MGYMAFRASAAGIPEIQVLGVPSLATRLYSVFFFIISKCMHVQILHRDLWPTAGHLV